jgi:hypothetical protein
MEVKEYFTCERCGRMLVKGRSDEAAEQEMRDAFSDEYQATSLNRAVICSHCYADLMVWAITEHPEILKPAPLEP